MVQQYVLLRSVSSALFNSRILSSSCEEARPETVPNYLEKIIRTGWLTYIHALFLGSCAVAGAKTIGPYVSGASPHEARSTEGRRGATAPAAPTPDTRPTSRPWRSVCFLDCPHVTAPWVSQLHTTVCVVDAQWFRAAPSLSSVSDRGESGVTLADPDRNRPDSSWKSFPFTDCDCWLMNPWT